MNSIPHKAIILAGGKGTRLYPITLEIPKPLLTVRKKPIINYLIENFFSHGVSDIKVVIKEPDIEDFEWWKKRFGDKINSSAVSFEIEKEPMGTLGYVYHHLMPWIGEDQFYMSNADELKRVNLSKMRDFHHQHSGLATIALMEVENPSDYGVAVMNGEKISEFLEKPKDPPSSRISGGLYLISPDAFSHLDPEKTSEKFLMIEKDLFPALASRGALVGYCHDGQFFDCGTFERLDHAMRNFRQ